MRTGWRSPGIFLETDLLWECSLELFGWRLDHFYEVYGAVWRGNGGQGSWKEK